MKMTFRWYGSDSDSITLKQIRQIPGMSGLMGVLDYKAAGEVWTEEEIKAFVDEVHAAGLECAEVAVRCFCRMEGDMRRIAGRCLTFWPNYTISEILRTGCLL